MKTHIILTLAAALILTGCTTTRSNIATTSSDISKARDDYERYVLTYYPLAVEQMNKYGIPASITLAQGLLESGAGKSELARKSNNHFGIKCGGDWNGRTVSHNDDARGECFRAYKHFARGRGA